MTQSLMSKAATVAGKPSIDDGHRVLMGFAEATCGQLLRSFGDLQTAEGIVALGYVVARFVAPALVATVETREDLNKQLVFVSELLGTTFRTSAEAAWTAAKGAKQEKTEPLLVKVPSGLMPS
jgi:hypothetical protein